MPSKDWRLSELGQGAKVEAVALAKYLLNQAYLSQKGEILPPVFLQFYNLQND